MIIDHDETTMPTPMEIAEAEAMKRFQEEPADLADKLRLSVSSREEVVAAWDAEIERRIADFEAGPTKVVPAEQVFAKLRAIIGKPDKA
ncbi:MAG: addiction module protein [Gammaproteobacteria bacterium]